MRFGAWCSVQMKAVKKYLSDRGIQLSDEGKGKRKAELVKLCRNAAARKQSKLDEVVDSYDHLLRPPVTILSGQPTGRVGPFGPGVGE